jgi:putative ABC transport system permease protein
MLWLFRHGIRRGLRRLVLAAIGVAFPVAMLGATLLFVDGAVHSMTRIALEPVQVEMRGVATSLTVDMNALDRQLATVKGVQRVDRFAAADVVVSVPGSPVRVPARLFAVDPSYPQNHPWVRVTAGSLGGGGALLGESLRNTPGLGTATSISIDLPGEVPEGGTPLSLPLPVQGTVDLRRANTWFAIPLGEVQGDIASVPRSFVIDYATFERAVLPALRTAAPDQGSGVFNQGATDLAPVSLEAHIAVDHAAYPTDPARAARWSTTLRRVLERQTPGAIVVGDNAAEALALATDDATNAKILFLLLGIPGALVAAGLGLAAASALVEAQRREEALLRLRGATGGQLARLTSANAALAGLIGAALGLVVAAVSVSAVTGRDVWREVPPGRLAVTAAIAVAAGVLTTAARLVPVVRASRRAEVVTERRLLEQGWTPTWRGVRLEVILIGVAGLILAVNVIAGGLRQTPIEGQTLALAFYVLLAPIALWFGVTLLLIRLLRGLLVVWTGPARSRPLTRWSSAALRWLGRRPARTGAALVLGALAVAFGTNVVTFAATYEQARHADTTAVFGSDLRVTPADPQAPPPRLGPEVAASTPIRQVPARVGTDRKSILAIDAASYPQATTIAPRILSGGGVEALVTDPKAVLVDAELAGGFALAPGDTATITIFPDDPGRTRNLNLKVAGVFRAFPPTEPAAEIVTTTAAIPPPLVPADFYLARVVPGHSATQVANDVRRLTPGFTVTTIADRVTREQRSLTTLDLHGLGRLESIAAAAIAAVGVAVLGAFLVLERRRESAILRAVGATTGQVLTAPAVEGGIAVLGSLLIGVPVGIGLSILAVRVLGLFFTLPPPLVVLPTGALASLAAFMIAMSAVALGVALRRVARQDAAPVLREP